MSSFNEEPRIVDSLGVIMKGNANEVAMIADGIAADAEDR